RRTSCRAPSDWGSSRGSEELRDRRCDPGRGCRRSVGTARSRRIANGSGTHPATGVARSTIGFVRRQHSALATGCHSPITSGSRDYDVKNPLAEAAAYEPEDRRLVRQAQRGSRAALEQLITRHQAWTYNIV